MQGYFQCIYGLIPHTSFPFNFNGISSANNSSSGKECILQETKGGKA